MAKGTVYPSERGIWRDPRSGLRIIRLTHSACISTNLYFEFCSFSPDDRYVVILSQRYAGRDAPWDVMRARTDGTELVQMTDTDTLGGAVVVSTRQGCIFYRADHELRRMDIASLEETVVAETPGKLDPELVTRGSVDRAGTVYFGNMIDDDGMSVMFLLDLTTGESVPLHEAGRHGHIDCDPSGKTVAFCAWRQGETPGHYLIDADGQNLRPYPFNQFAHNTWFGESGTLQGTLLPPGRAIVTHTEGDEEPTVLTSGRYYWHSGASLDAQWIVADTNWPAQGLYLLHVPTRNVAYVCDPKASCSHPQWTHPHPALSANMKYVVYNSDMTGIGQVYLTEFTEEYLADIVAGPPCKTPLWK